LKGNGVLEVIETISPATYHRSETLRAALLGGFVAGALRIIYAFVTSAADGQNPQWVLQSIASGLLGANAFNGGLVAAALGALFHFGIAIVAAGIYIAASSYPDGRWSDRPHAAGWRADRAGSTLARPLLTWISAGSGSSTQVSSIDKNVTPFKQLRLPQRSLLLAQDSGWCSTSRAA
jgi:hypothetical protein